MINCFLILVVSGKGSCCYYYCMEREDRKTNFLKEIGKGLGKGKWERGWECTFRMDWKVWHWADRPNKQKEFVVNLNSINKINKHVHRNKVFPHFLSRPHECFRKVDHMLVCKISKTQRDLHTFKWMPISLLFFWETDCKQ